ncbi:MAG: SDR family NAD(P)-dependent oxidoreductase [Cryobacterium sp.]|nr:SDR family NAD(P)-dependent oxidoreductase [Cryobacterium sp.]
MLNDKTVVITGAGGGLGRAYAVAAGAAGANVVVNDVNLTAARAVAEELTASGSQAIAVGGSVSSWEDSEALVDECTRRFGQIDGLVTNAGIKHEAHPWDETEENLRSIAEVNILGVQFIARHAMRAMVDQGVGGSIVNIVSGAQFGIRGMSAYGASKGAVTAMTANWAKEAELHHIRVNAISPLAMTPMAAQDTRDDVPDLPDPNTVAPLVVALLSDEAVGITGHTIRFDGRSMSRYTAPEITDSSMRSEGWSAEELVRHISGW